MHMLHLILSFVRALSTTRVLFFLLVSVVDFVFVFGFLLRLSPAASSSHSSSPSSGFVWFRPAARGLLVLPRLVSSTHLEIAWVLSSPWSSCCPTSSFHPMFHTILFVHVSVLFLVRLTCASGHKKPGGRVPAVLVCFPGVGLHPDASWLASAP